MVASKRKQQKQSGPKKPPKRTKNHRTAQDPFEFEALRDEEQYEVEALHARWSQKGIPYYEVKTSSGWATRAPPRSRSGTWSTLAIASCSRQGDQGGVQLVMST